MAKSKVSNIIDYIQSIAVELNADYKAYLTLDKLDKSIHMHEARLRNLEQSFEEARGLHQKIIAAAGDEAKIKYMEDLTFHKVKELYYKYSSELKAQLQHTDIQPQAQSSLNNSTTGAKAAFVEFNLPPIKIPTFSGSFQTWPEFKSLFESLVIKNSSISDVQKLHYLKANLGGEAERLLRNTAITDGNFESAWATLVKRYQNLRFLKDTQFNLLFKQPSLSHESADGLKSLIDTTNEAKQSLENLGVPVKSWEEILIYHTVQKLPLNTRGLWESHISSYVDYPTYTILEDFLLMRARTLDVMGQTNSYLPSYKTKGTASTVRSHNSTIYKCSLCQGLHSIRNCFKFKALNPKKRLDIVKRNKLCVNCLSPAHKTQNCTSAFTCSYCKQRHHSLLHMNENYTPMPENDNHSMAIIQPSPPETAYSPQHPHAHSAEGPSTSTKKASTFNACLAENSKVQTVLLATALVKVYTTTGQSLTLRALLDPGSEASFITESAAQMLNLKKERSVVSIFGIGETNMSVSKHKVSLIIHSNFNSTFKLQLQALVLPRLTAVLPMRNISYANWIHLQNMELADPNFNKPSKIDILLGSDVYSSILLDGIVKGAPGTPMAQKTELGWVISGGTCNNQSSVSSCHTTTESSDLDTLLTKFWELEEGERKTLLSPEEKQCELHFCRSHQRLADGKYVVSLPFKEGKPPILGLSYNLALVRLLQLERKFKSNPKFHEEYKAVFDEYKEQGHMTEINLASLTGVHYFIPHHAVIKEASSTTKLRIVFDASCKTSDGTSLNDHLLAGPRLQDDIFDHIARFRQHQIGFVADISKMYRQIWIAPQDSVYQCILWREKEGEEVTVFRLNTVTFGTTSAPYLAIRTLQQLALDEREDYPIASKISFNNFYVDDVIHGADSVEEAVEIQYQLTTMLRRGGFPLRKWASNSEILLAAIPGDDREVQLPLSFDEGNAIKTLGIQWHPGRDIFKFTINLPDQKRTTKRTVLSDIARLYDPMGWISPCVITGKILMQEIWKEHQTWDSELPSSIISAWHRLKEELNAINTLEIPRWVSITKSSHIEIHGFCDASEKAYAAAVYLRVINGSTIATNLLLSKTRVAPLKKKSLARLELCGALLLAQLLVHTVETMSFNNRQIFAWCDSQITLAWIKSVPYTRTTFVANRVAEIQELTDSNFWNYISSNDNPADLASRGISPMDLITCQQWWHGPDFLQTFDSNRYSSHVIPTTELETKTAERSKGSKLARLSPIIDENGLLRVGGRLENANLPYSQRHPLILPAQNDLIRLIIHDVHMKTLHGGQQLMMATLRSEYWIFNLKSNVKRCIHSCIRCYRHTATQMQQKMGNLPALRVNQARPFQTSGVDYAGPVQLKAWKGRCNKITKAYIAIFVCFCTKAVHIELVSDYSTAAFCAAFRRFTARRGICTNLYSDCGTNFQGASRIMGQERSHHAKQWKDDIATQLQANGTTWHFNPPAAPHFGGLWEAGVKSIKYHLKRIIGHYTLTFEEYVTVLTQVEACLNSRPLCPVTEDVDDLSILTPGHFLIGAPLNTVPEKDLSDVKPNYLDRWELLQKIQQDFWKKWKSEYLVRLQQRTKWLTSNLQLQIGNLVLLPDEQTPPTLWKLGRIVATHPGKDGRIRVVTIKTATTSLTRPIAKLCLLPMANE